MLFWNNLLPFSRKVAYNTLYRQNVQLLNDKVQVVHYSWNVMAHFDARDGKRRGNWRMEWVASTLHTTSEHGVCSITIADAHTSAARSRRNWRPRRFKWTRPFRRKTQSIFCACAITFKLASTKQHTITVFRLLVRNIEEINAVLFSPLNFIFRRFGTLCSIFIGGGSTQPIKMKQTDCFETSEHQIQTPRTYPKERRQHSEHDERLKSRKLDILKW